MHFRKIIAVAVFIVSYTVVNAQANFKGWHLADPQKDTLQGISLQTTYEFLKGKKGKTVIVAVIDGGIDTTHEDLKPVLWRNTKEIPGNGIDDDGNGYIDDIHGWNFIGGKDGRNIKKESMEASRIFHKYKEKFHNKAIDETQLTREEHEAYALWKVAADILEVDREEQMSVMFLEVAYKAAAKHGTTLAKEMSKESFTAEEVEKFHPETQSGKQAKMGYLTFLRLTEMEREETNKSIFSQLEEYIEDKKKSFEAKDVAPVNYREDIVKDDYYNLNDRFYGNNDVMGPSPMHGTHVSGIIAAKRNNGIGIDGVAENVQIMTLRAVPDGDEYDKDIALAIKYAVDNGAKVINMSFGKGLSPEKKWVDEAVRYAEMKDVLLVHAAGNDGSNNDETPSYPNRNLKSLSSKATNYLTVGASSDPAITNTAVATFSNYGKNSVDVFAPGVKIYSTIPGGNTYGFQQGTSMAAPVVSGVAALIRSYFPALSAAQVKKVIESSVDKPENPVVNKPGSKEEVTFAELCASGGRLNAYKALKLAATLQPENKEAPKQNQSLPKSTFKNKPLNQ